MTNDQMTSYLNTVMMARVQEHVAKLKIPMEFSKLQALADHATMALIRRLVHTTVTFEFIQGAVLGGSKGD